ncbi:MAG: M13 family metallopeptidase [Thermomicrobiales bacterium]
MKSKRSVALGLACAFVLSWPNALMAQEATPAVGVARPGSLLVVMDPAVDPGEDFYYYATGGWLDATEIPSDEPAYNIFAQVADTTREQLIALLERLAAEDTLAVGSDEWKAVQLFAQVKDLETRNAQAIDPIAGDLAVIDAIASLDDLYAFLREAPLTTNVWCGLHCVFVYPDYADSSVYAAWHSSPYLGLPSRDYYWEDAEGNEEIREAYRQMNAELLGYIGYTPEDAAEAAQQVYDFEKRLAEPMFLLEEWNDPANYYNPQPIADLVAANPDVDWPAFLAILGIEDQERLVVQEVDYLASVSDIVAATDLETIKDFLTLQVLQLTGGTLSEEIGESVFAFYGTALNGIEEQRPIEERALEAVNESLGFALGKLYVEEYFSPEAKAQVEEMVDYTVAATRERIDGLEWMDPNTKAAAQEKLDALRVKVGYPEEWRTYDDVSIEASYAQTRLSARIAETKRWLGRVGEPVDRDEWTALPQEVNAYYNPSNNEIVLLAGILQPPFFVPEADLAYNYGATGMTIGHEITHAYDQSGAQFDADGNLADWWTEGDLEEFDARSAAVAAQFSAIEVLPDVFINGDLTIAEDTADLGGLQIAYDALHLALADAGDPGLIEGLTPDQRFFLAYAYSSVEEAREEALRAQVQTDFHSPLQVRAVQPSLNMDEFFAAFAIEPGDPMYLPPEKRIVIW